jgi:hypothetical protein
MIDNDERLKPNFDHINELIIFSQSNNFDSEMNINIMSPINRYHH